MQKRKIFYNYIIDYTFLAIDLYVIRAASPLYRYRGPVVGVARAIRSKLQSEAIKNVYVYMRGPS